MKWLVLLLLLAACSVQKQSPLIAPREAPAAGGTDFGGGGDLDEGPKAEHWFSGKSSVSYCLQVSPDFGVSEGEVADLVSQSFGLWEKYIADKKLPKSVLSIQASRTECEATTPLVFLFGVWKPELEDAKTHYRNPVAFAHKRGDVGHVWFAARATAWKNSSELKTLLLHELGHVYGNPHVPRTVMQSDIALHLGDLPAEKLGRIDFEGELALCFGCDLHLDVRFRPEPGSESWMSLKRLLNRPPEGEVRVRFSRILTSGLFLLFPIPNLLLITDERGEILWTGSAFEETILQKNQIPVFNWSSNGVTSSVGSGWASVRTDYTTENGKDTVRLSLELYPPRLHWIEQGFAVSLLP